MLKKEEEELEHFGEKWDHLKRLVFIRTHLMEHECLDCYCLDVIDEDDLLLHTLKDKGSKSVLFLRRTIFFSVKSIWIISRFFSTLNNLLCS